MTPQQFKVEMEGLTKKLIPSQLVTVQKKLALEIFNGVVMGNPVGNPTLWKNNPPKGYTGGESRQAWEIVHGSPSERVEIVGLSDPKKRGASVKGSAPDSQQMAGAVAAMADVKPFQTLTVYNRKPWMLRLEEGWSTQAAMYWIRSVVKRVVEQVKEISGSLSGGSRGRDARGRFI